MLGLTTMPARWLILLALFPGQADRPGSAFHEFTGKVIHIADGDTLTVLDRENAQYKVRLHGIDAPEKAQAFGTKAKEALAEKVHEKTVRVVWKERDRYGRTVGDVWLPDRSGERNINIEMVQEGYAWWYRAYAPHSKALEQAEARARTERLGLWRDREPEPPWEFRKKERETKSGQRR
jgi:endonuclease YncB( thermonuclease family)